MTLVIDGVPLTLTPRHAFMTIMEFPKWEQYYTVGVKLNNTIVLDIGAGAGETAFLFFANGARKVVAVEPNTQAAEMLRRNAEVNHWNVEIIESNFELRHLELHHDFMKMDCEGCEANLMNLSKSRLGDFVIEAHSKATSIQLMARFGLRIVQEDRNGQVAILRSSD